MAVATTIDLLGCTVRQLDCEINSGRCCGAWSNEVAPKVSAAMKALAIYMELGDEAMLDALRGLNTSELEDAVASFRRRYDELGQPRQKWFAV